MSNPIDPKSEGRIPDIEDSAEEGSIATAQPLSGDRLKDAGEAHGNVEGKTGKEASATAPQAGEKAKDQPPHR